MRMNRNKYLVLVHVAAWSLMYLTPLSFFSHDNGNNLALSLAICMAPLLQMVAFYTNYFGFIPKLYVKRKKRQFWIYNALLVVVLGLALHFWMHYAHGHFDHGAARDATREIRNIDRLFFIFRDVTNICISAAMGATVSLALRWQHIEKALAKAEAKRTEAELKSLRAQIKPHFLLNTLNNIYALTAFDSGKAQKAIHELSQLLRHLLYDNQRQMIPISEEIGFLSNYIQLMQLRLSPEVEVKLEQKIENPKVEVAPLLFISLVENAFKHGISATEARFIHISIYNRGNEIFCHIENSNHPKGDGDRSGHGIGLQQVKQRLELIYPHRYRWEKGTRGKGRVYYSSITLTT